jgi:hypothetical protein
MRRESELKKREQMVEVMTRKLSYNAAKVGSPTTSDDSNSSADNNYGHGGSQSPNLRGDNNGGSPPGRGRQQPTLADFQSQSSGDLSAKVAAEEVTQTRSQRGFPAKGQSSPYYGPTGDASSTPSTSNRLRDAPEQVANLVSHFSMKKVWTKVSTPQCRFL